MVKVAPILWMPRILLSFFLGFLILFIHREWLPFCFGSFHVLLLFPWDILPLLFVTGDDFESDYSSRQIFNICSIFILFYIQSHAYWRHSLFYLTLTISRKVTIFRGGLWKLNVPACPIQYTTHMYIRCIVYIVIVCTWYVLVSHKNKFYEL